MFDERIAKVIKCSNFKYYEEQIPGYVIVPVKEGAKIHIAFDDRDSYLIFTRNSVPLFYNNDYIGGVLVEYRYAIGRKKVEWTYVHTFFIRANAAVLSDRNGEYLIAPIGQDADIIFGFIGKSDLEEHFIERYAELKKTRPQDFERKMAKLKAMNLRIEPDEDSLIAIS